MDKLNKLIKNLESVQKGLKSFEVSVKTDEDGYFDKECPNQDCLFPFKVDADDWTKNFKDEKVFCPNCKNESAANTYHSSELIKQVKSELIRHIKDKLFKGKSFPQKLLPYESTKKWNLKIECEICLSKYSVIGSAFFCPCCGHNSIERNFEDSIRKVKIKLDSIRKIRPVLINNIGVDETEIMIRSIKESSLIDSVVSFQHYSNLIFKKFTGNKPKFNVFQRIQDGSAEWKSNIGEGYDDWLNANEKGLMNKMFQQRHLFSHNDGIVDQKYIDKSQDHNYKQGQRIVVNDSEIQELIQIILKITNRIKEHGG